jgi:hypothetical protein
LWPSPWRRSSSRRWGGFERVAQSALDRAIQRATVEDETNGATLDAWTALCREELVCERERVANAQAHQGVKLPGEGELEEGCMRDASRHAASRGGDARDIVLGQNVVGPLDGCVDGK